VLARYGGEEFIAVLPEADIDGARRVSERIRLLVGGTITKHNGKNVSATISIGLAVFPADGRTAKELMAAADRALYGAKASGRNQVQAAQTV
jgi:diguanylate cyclase (GGDEF)-like protein